MRTKKAKQLNTNKPLKIETMKDFIVTVKHDQGTKKIRVTAIAEDVARNMVYMAENCPESAIIKVREAQYQKKANQELPPTPENAKIKCNNCDWQGDEEDLTLFEYDTTDEKETVTSEEDSHGIIKTHSPRPAKQGFFKGCPNCKTDGHLMDIEPPTPVSELPEQTEWNLPETINYDYPNIGDPQDHNPGICLAEMFVCENPNDREEEMAQEICKRYNAYPKLQSDNADMIKAVLKQAEDKKRLQEHNRVLVEALNRIQGEFDYSFSNDAGTWGQFSEKKMIEMGDIIETALNYLTTKK